jgi:hypothetical protein
MGVIDGLDALERHHAGADHAVLGGVGDRP